MPRKTHFLWDWDGTKHDSQPLVHLFYDELCRREGVDRQWEGYEQFRAWFDNNWFNNLERLGIPMNGSSNALYKEMVGSQPANLFPGIPELVASLGGPKMVHSIVTGSYEDQVTRQVSGSGLNGLISRVEGYVEGEPIKPDPFIFLKTLKALGCGPGEAIAIGDTAHDMVAAARAHIQRRVVVTYGFSTRERLECELEEASVNAVFADTVDELADALQSQRL